MRTTRFDNLEAGSPGGRAPHKEAALFFAALTFGLAMLSLLAVLLLADIVPLTRILPFFALPLVLFSASAPLLRLWGKGEAEEAAIEEVAQRPSTTAATRR